MEAKHQQKQTTSVRCKCVICKKQLKLLERRPLTGTKNEQLRHYIEQSFFIHTDENSYVCNKCRQKYYTAQRKENNMNDIESDCEEKDPSYEPPIKDNVPNVSASSDNIALGIPRAGACHSRCFLCKKSGPKLVTLKLSVRHQIFFETGILLSKSARCCPKHTFGSKSLDRESIESMRNKNIKVNNVTEFTGEELVELIHTIRRIANDQQEKGIRFDEYLPAEDYRSLTGFDKSDFENLLGYFTSSKMHVSNNRDQRTGLGIFLTKMRSGLSNRILGTIFNMKKGAIRRCINRVRKILGGQFVDENIGFKHITRKDVILKKTRPLAKLLLSENECSPPAILVLDGTYLYIQKSQQFKFQRRTYSMHKKRQLVKPMMIVTTSGYIVSAIGPFLADGKNSDASILTHLVKQNVEEIKEWVQEGDVFVVDRGFRDAIPVLNSIGIRSEMPSFLSKGQAQFTSSEANSTRLVTKIRWVVESVNSRLKQWQFFSKTLNNSHLPHISAYLRIVCALLNRFKSPLSETQNTLEDIEIANRMKILSKQKNKLENLVRVTDKKEWQWEKIDLGSFYDLNCFPALTQDKLREITVGVYAIKLAPFYTQEHITSGAYELFVSKKFKGMLHLKIQSRHTSALKHKLWVRFSENDVLSWYCTCKTGTRVVGCCAHVASVIWCLGQRHVDSQKSSDWYQYVSDAKEE